MRTIIYFYFFFTHEFQNVLRRKYLDNLIKCNPVATLVFVTPTHYVINLVRASLWSAKLISNVYELLINTVVT